jgi:hypothetical protein
MSFSHGCGGIGSKKGLLVMKRSYDAFRGIRVLERILTSRKAGREKKLLALIGLINIASGGRSYRLMGG